jgi:hypothetical protein
MVAHNYKRITEARRCLESFHGKVEERGAAGLASPLYLEDRSSWSSQPVLPEEYCRRATGIALMV